MRQYLLLSLLLISCCCSAQFILLPTVRDPTIAGPGVVSLRRDPVTGFLKEKAKGQPEAFVRIDSNQVLGWGTLSVRFLNLGQSVDSRFSTLQTQTNALGVEVAGKATTAQLTTVTGRLNGIDQTNAAQNDSINKKLNIADFQAATSGLASSSATYNQTQINAFNALKANVTDLASLSANTYAKAQVDAKFQARSVFDAALSGGFFLVTGNPAWDNTAGLQYAFNNPGAGKTIAFMDGKLYARSSLELPNGTNLTGSNAATLVAGASFSSVTVGGNEAGYLIRAGNDNVITGVHLDGGGYDVGGFLVLGKSNVTIQHCSVRNLTGIRFGFGVNTSPHTKLLFNQVFDGPHAFNFFRSDWSKAIGNHAERNISGIYTEATNHFEAAFNSTIHNKDVGFDSEHGKHNHWHHNYAESCKNGEFTMFDGGPQSISQGTMTDVIFSDNVAVRNPTYVTSLTTGGAEVRDSCSAILGALNWQSVAAGAQNCGFERNTVMVYYGLGFSNPAMDKSGRDLFLRDNTFTTYGINSQWLRSLNSDGFKIIHNRLYAKSGSENQSNEIRDAHNFTLADNTLVVETPRTTTLPLINLNAATAGFITIPAAVERNRFRGVIPTAFASDLFAQVSAVPTLRANEFSDGYTSTGGLSVPTGAVRYVDQKLKLLLSVGANNLSSISALAGWRFGTGSGQLNFGRQAALGTLSTVTFYKGDQGLFVNSVTTITLNAYTVTANNATLTLANGTGDATPVSGSLDATLNSH